MNIRLINLINLLLAGAGIYLFFKKWLYADITHTRVDLLTVADDSGYDLALGKGLYGLSWGANPSLLFILVFYGLILIITILSTLNLLPEKQAFVGNLWGSVIALIVLGCEYARLAIDRSNLDERFPLGNFSFTYESAWWLTIFVCDALLAVNFYAIRKTSQHHADTKPA